MNSRQLAERIEDAKAPYDGTEGWWAGKCPAHQDDNPSFGWKDGDKKILIKCQAGCTRAEVLDALGLTERDTWLDAVPSDTSPRTVGRPTATYSYRDESGALLYQAVRYERDGKKTFSIQRPDPSNDGYFLKSLGKDTRRVLYRTDKIQGEKRVVVVEGEKDCDRLAESGLAVTTSPLGAGKWRPEYAQQLVDAGAVAVTVVPDLDEPGMKHMIQVLESCVAAGLIVTYVPLSEVVDGVRTFLTDGGDVSDYLDRNTVDDLFALLLTPSAFEDTGRFTVPPADMTRIEAEFTTEELAGFGETMTRANLDALLALLGVETPYGEPPVVVRERPKVLLPGDPGDDTNAMWKVLMDANDPPVLYAYGDGVFKMQRDASMAILDVDRIRQRLVQLARFVMRSRDGVRPVVPETQRLKMMLVDEDKRAQLPALNRIVHTPVFTADGRLVQSPGYYAESGVYLTVADGLAVPPVSDAPTVEEVARARPILLEDVFVDFPFTGQADKATIVALTLLPFARDLIRGATPLHVIAAARPGTGKSLLLQVVTTISVGRNVAGMTEAGDEDETRKRITASLLDEPTYVIFENLNKMLRGGAVAQALTATEWTDRILQVSKMVTIPVRCCWVAVANNPSFSEEVADRIVTCRIVSPLERPRDRDLGTVKHKNLGAWVSENRGELIWACLTLVQNWIARGRKPGQAMLGSFQAWAETMSGILEAAGVTGLLENRRKILELADPVGDSRKAFVEMWYADSKLETRQPKDLVALADAAGCPVDAGKVNKDGSMAQSERARMGKVLRDLFDQVFVMPDGVPVTVAPGDPPRLPTVRPTASSSLRGSRKIPRWMSTLARGATAMTAMTAHDSYDSA